MQHVGRQQLLVLLLVLQAEGEQGVEPEVAGDQLLHRRIDVGPVGGHVVRGRPGDHAAGEARVPCADGFVVGVEQVAELAAERLVAVRMGQQHELLEEPGGVGAVPFGGAGVRHGLDALVLGRQVLAQPFGVVADRPECADG